MAHGVNHETISDVCAPQSDLASIIGYGDVGDSKWTSDHTGGARIVSMSSVVPDEYRWRGCNERYVSYQTVRPWLRRDRRYGCKGSVGDGATCSCENNRIT